MNPINILLSLTSLNVLLVTAERFSFTTRILLQPYNYLRLHEIVQMSLIILMSVIIPVFLLKYLSHNFESLKTKKGQIYGLLFVIGIYFYATGNGLHEVASFLFNHYCEADHTRSAICGSLFFNDYYTGNILFFIGGYCMNIALIFLERLRPTKAFTRKELIILVVNSLIYAFAICAYAAFDRVSVGAVFSIITTATVSFLLLHGKKEYRTMPFTLYCVISYSIATVVSLLIRFL